MSPDLLSAPTATTRTHLMIARPMATTDRTGSTVASSSARVLGSIRMVDSGAVRLADSAVASTPAPASTMVVDSSVALALLAVKDLPVEASLTAVQLATVSVAAQSAAEPPSAEARFAAAQFAVADSTAEPCAAVVASMVAQSTVVAGDSTVAADMVAADTGS